MLSNKKFWKAAFVRSFKTVCQTLLGTLPVGFSITPTMIHNANWSMMWALLAWLGTGALSGVISMLTSISTGLPEVEE